MRRMIAIILISHVILALLLAGCGTPDMTGERNAWETTPTGLKYKVVELGFGRPAAAGDVVRVHYTGWLWINGTRGEMFDSSVGGDPIEFRLGAQQVIAGWEEGIAGMHEGGKRELLIPPELAYGETGVASVIPPDATLNFEVELVEIVNR